MILFKNHPNVKLLGLRLGRKVDSSLILIADGGYVLEAMSTLKTDRFLVCAVQVIDDFRNRYDKLQEIWKSVPRDPTKYFEAT